MIIDCAHYKDGERQHEGKLSLEEASKCASGAPGEFVWLGLFEPSADELHQVAE
jgi:magnesium transporter